MIFGIGFRVAGTYSFGPLTWGFLKIGSGVPGRNVLETLAAFCLKLPRQKDDVKSDIFRSGVGGLPRTHRTFCDVFQAVCASFSQIQPRTFPKRVGEWIDKAQA